MNKFIAKSIQGTGYGAGSDEKENDEKSNDEKNT